MAGRALHFSSKGSKFLTKQFSKKHEIWNNFSTNPSKGSVSGSDEPPCSFCQPPLSKALPGLPPAKYASPNDEDRNTKITVLSNGLRVASESRFGQFCTVGVVIDSGSRYELSYPSGISHFLEKLAFNSTTNFADKDKILLTLEKHGGICDCQSSRDTFVYAASAETKGLDPVVKVLGDIILRPQITADEIDMTRQAISFELENLRTRPEQELLLMDMIHAAGYRNNTLGLPKICPEDNIDKIDRKVLFTYLKNHYTPNRMVIAGVGIEHEALLESVNKYFVEDKPVWVEDKSLILPGDNYGVDQSIAQYTGGLVQEECEIPQFAGPSGLPELVHVMIGLEGCSHQDPDFVAMCVLNMMMGGGGSFSAGGPGKGMYTRLYTNVLNRYHWMFNATAYNNSYLDTGLFCIHASAPPTHLRDIVEVLVKEMVAMGGSVHKDELRRAKTQLQSMLLMNLEARPVVFEDIARQVLATSHRKRPEFYIEQIENVTESDIQRVAQRLLQSPPAVAARGDISKLPALKDIQSGLQDANGRMSNGKKISLFH